MMVTVHISGGLSEYCRCPAEITIAAITVGSAMDAIQREYPSLYVSVCNETGRVREHLNLFVNSDMIPVHQGNGFETPLRPGDVLTIWQAVSGG